VLEEEEDKGQLFFQLVEEGDEIFFCQLVVGDNQHVRLQGEGDGQHGELPLSQAEGVLEEDDKGQLFFQLVVEGGGMFFFQLVVGDDQHVYLQGEVDSHHVCLQGEGDDLLFCHLSCLEKEDGDDQEVCIGILEQLPVFWLVGECGKALLFQMGVGRGGAHVEEGGADSEEGDNVLDVQLLYDSGVCQAAETLPKSHELHHCHNPSLN